jgi:hypothetical protein
MTTSGSVNFNQTCLQIITDAYAIIRVGVEEEALTNQQAQEGRSVLNTMTKAWMADGLHLWSKTECGLFLVEGTQKYDIASTSTDHHALVTDIVQTTISADEAAGQTVISLTSITGLAASDRIGIELDDGTVQWTTISGAPAGGTATIAVALTAAAASGNTVYGYTTKLNRPNRILHCMRRDEDGIETEAQILERPDYFRLPNKDSDGPVTNIYYDPQRDNGYLYVWPTSDNSTDTLRFTGERLIEDFDTLTNNADFPVEWLEPLAFNLAYRLSYRHSFPLQERVQLRMDALGMKEKLLGFDREYGSVFFQPNMGP